MENSPALITTNPIKDVAAPVEADRSRAISEVQAAVAMAKHFPRNEVDAVTRIRTACQRESLAKLAAYSYPRGKEKVTGASIRLAETIARHWGNLQYGFRILEQDKNKSVVETFCWDLEVNTRTTRVFTVEHRMKANNAEKVLTDARDVYEHVANNSQRRVRACILQTVPGDVVEDALSVCRKTLAQAIKEKPLVDRVRDMVTAFAALSVTKEMIEKRLQHAVEQASVEEIVDLQEIYNSLRDKQSKRQDWFDFGVKTASALNDKLKPQEPEAPKDEADGPDFDEA